MPATLYLVVSYDSKTIFLIIWYTGSSSTVVLLFLFLPLVVECFSFSLSVWKLLYAFCRCHFIIVLLPFFFFLSVLCSRGFCLHCRLLLQYPSFLFAHTYGLCFAEEYVWSTRALLHETYTANWYRYCPVILSGHLTSWAPLQSIMLLQHMCRVFT